MLQLLGLQQPPCCTWWTYSREEEESALHFFWDNYFTAVKLFDKLITCPYHFIGIFIKKDRVKGNSLTTVDKFKKKERGYLENVVLEQTVQDQCPAGV
jgi:hypothetical protein